MPPHVPQLPFAQVPVSPGHVLPEPTQVFATQQPPLLQVPVAQHAEPAAPHAAQVPLAHTNPEAHSLPAQHASPPPPQVWQTPV